MLRKHPPFWVYLGGFSLTLIAGTTNAIGFLGVAHQGMTHVTGTVTLSAIELAHGNTVLALRAMTVVVFFFLGAAVSGFIIRDSHLRLSRRYGVALLVESLLLFGAVVAFRQGSLVGEYFAAAASGLQNAMASSYGGATLRTTHLTGIITDLGSSIGQAFHRLPFDWFRFRLYSVLVFGFALGGLIGGSLYPVYGSDSLVISAALASALGIGALIWLSFWKGKNGSHLIR